MGARMANSNPRNCSTVKPASRTVSGELRPKRHDPHYLGIISSLLAVAQARRPPGERLAIESGSEWITTDRDYARFPGLRWRTPW